MKCIASMLDVQTDRVDNTVGADHGGFYGTLVMCIGSDLFDAVALSPQRMPRGASHRGAGLAQLAHDATTKKTSPAKHGYTAHFQVRRAIRRDALDGPVKRCTHRFNGLCRRIAFADVMRDHIDQNLRGRAD